MTGNRSVDELWTEYGRARRPTNIGDRVAGALLGELDDDVQDVVGSYMGLREKMGARRVARLGLALAEITRILPEIKPPETRRYFLHVATLARAVLEKNVAGGS